MRFSRTQLSVWLDAFIGGPCAFKRHGAGLGVGCRSRLTARKHLGSVSAVPAILKRIFAELQAGPALLFRNAARELTASDAGFEG